MVFHKIPDNRGVRLLRQDNLAFYAEVNARAFTVGTVTEVPLATYLRIIDQVKSEIVPVANGPDLTKPAKYYYNLMIGQSAGYDHRKTEPWIGTDKRNDSDVVILLEPAVGVLRFLSDLDSDQGFLAVSSLSNLEQRLARTAARMMGDADQEIMALEIRAAEIQTEIATLKARGAQPMTQRERQVEVHALLHDISQIKAGFAEVPVARRRINHEMQDVFLESELPPGGVLDIFFQSYGDWERSGEYAVLSTLRALYLKLEHARLLQWNLETIAREASDLLTPYQRSMISSFLMDMLKISSDIMGEITSTWSTVRAYISNPAYAARREDARALRDALTASMRIRDEVRPTPRDARLKNLGLTLTLPLGTSLGTDLKLTTETPVVDIGTGKIAEEVDEVDSEAVIERAARQKARSRYLNDERMAARVAEAMGEADEVTLSNLLRRFPLRYGRQEIVRYLSFAASKHPSRLIPDASFVVRFREREATTLANVPNLAFCRSGEIGQEFGDLRPIDYLMAPEDLRRFDATDAIVDIPT